jgi:hypothetical protein
MYDAVQNEEIHNSQLARDRDGGGCLLRTFGTPNKRDEGGKGREREECLTFCGIAVL